MAGTLFGAGDLKIKQSLSQQVAHWNDSKESSRDPSPVWPSCAKFDL